MASSLQLAQDVDATSGRPMKENVPMSIACKSLVRSVLVASALGALAVGCSAAAGDEATGASTDALTTLPEANCTLIAGSTASEMHTGFAVMRVGGGYTGTDTRITGFVQAVHAAGGTGGYTVFQVQGGLGVSWYAIDVTHVAESTMTSLVNTSPYNAPPVSAGYYSCSYNWGDYQL